MDKSQNGPRGPRGPYIMVNADQWLMSTSHVVTIDDHEGSDSPANTIRATETNNENIMPNASETSESPSITTGESTAESSAASEEMITGVMQKVNCAYNLHFLKKWVIRENLPIEVAKKEARKICTSTVMLDSRTVQNYLTEELLNMALQETRDEELEHYGLTKCHVVLDKSAVENWQHDEQLVKLNGLKSCQVVLNADDVSNWQAQKKHSPVNFAPEVVLVRTKNRYAANRKFCKRNRIMNINKKPDRPDVLQSDLVKSFSKAQSSHFQCTSCSKKYMNLKTLVAHRRSEHQGRKLYSCGTCGKLFSNSGNCHVHELSHMGTRAKKFVCQRCNGRFYTKGILKKHRLACGRRATWDCPMCDKSFACKEYVRRHLIQELSNRSYKCQRCGMQSRHYSAVFKHMQVTCVA